LARLKIKKSMPPRIGGRPHSGRGDCPPDSDLPM
jgi:hypothetical protein